jgi:hypothetical protein
MAITKDEINDSAAGAAQYRERVQGGRARRVAPLDERQPLVDQTRVRTASSSSLRPPSGLKRGLVAVAGATAIAVLGIGVSNRISQDKSSVSHGVAQLKELSESNVINGKGLTPSQNYAHALGDLLAPGSAERIHNAILSYRNSDEDELAWNAEVAMENIWNLQEMIRTGNVDDKEVKESLDSLRQDGWLNNNITNLVDAGRYDLALSAINEFPSRLTAAKAEIAGRDAFGR